MESIYKKGTYKGSNKEIYKGSYKKKKVCFFSIRRPWIWAAAVLLMLGLLFSVKPIRSVVLTYSIRLLSSFQENEGNETPDLGDAKCSVKVIQPETDTGAKAYTWVQGTAEEAHKGQLVLVNDHYGYRFLESDQLILVKQYKNNAYQLMDAKIKLSKKMVQALNRMMADFKAATGKHDLTITSGYRSLKMQDQALQEKEEALGDQEAQKWAMLPGYSEHHTGCAVDMSIYTDDDVHINYKGQEPYDWIDQNCFKYGIIRRYTEEKSNLTGVSDEPWHYRYVGIPHAYVMTLHRFCLEEYIQYIRQFSFGEKHLWVSTAEGNYEIYYVAADPMGTTQIPVPKGKAYTLSGNNIDGFIVTVPLA